MITSVFTGVTMHRIAPREPMPEFIIEAGYMVGLSIAWKLYETDLQDSDDVSINVEYLMQWSIHRKSLARYGGVYKGIIVDPLIKFMDALIADWLKVVHKQPPDTPLNDFRLQELNDWRRELDRIPSEMRIMY